MWVLIKNPRGVAATQTTTTSLGLGSGFVCWQRETK
jgi:hypothetical protein